ncbi:MAG TPA: DUF983 domain-containing protein [Actinomycetota bacterium]|nr:DUF983 domain-containing protein [Actinomycetota bacterium]
MPSLISALRGHCPICDEKNIWRSFGQTYDDCPRCGRRFEREDGYWVGALIVAIAIVMGLLVLVFVIPMMVTWPDVPWVALLAASLVVLGVSPFVFYPQSKTIWVWLDVLLFEKQR